MSRHRINFRYVLPVLLSLVCVSGCYLFLRASTPTAVEFTADTILSLEGVADGELLAAAGSGCSSLDIAAGNLAINGIPAGASFTLKTSRHSRALRVAPSVGNAELDLAANDLAAGDIGRFTLSPSVGVASTDIVWSAPLPETWYRIKANGSDYRSFQSDISSEIAFSFNLLSPTVFALEYDASGGGSVPVLPQKPDVSSVRIARLSGGRLLFLGLPEKISQAAISISPDFKEADWQEISNGSVELDPARSGRVYLRFRTARGGVSDTIGYVIGDHPITDLEDGDIVKTPDNPDVYIIKVRNGKLFRRLILSPHVFESYGHLKWGDIKTIGQDEMDYYSISSLVRETYDTVVYELTPDGDIGRRQIYAGAYDEDEVYEINATDRDSYLLE